jgi:hypothetical protein
LQDISLNRVDGDRIPPGWVALTVVGLEVALISSAVAWVAIYSYLISPGHDLPYYQKHAEFASPIVAVALGIPYFFLACRWIGRKAGTRAVAAAVWVWFIVFLIDVLLILVGGLNAYVGVMLTISHLTKMLAAYFGGKAALRDVLSHRL